MLLKKILKEAVKLTSWQEDIYSALHNIVASWVTSGRFPVDRLPAMTSGKIWKGTGGNVEEVDFPVGVPSEVIAMWHGTIANIPSGWVLCDGGSSTPNLLARFIEGVATAVTNPGATGGALGKTTSGHQHTNPTTSLPTAPYSFQTGPAYGVTVAAVDHRHTQGATGSKTDSISDIRPPYYDVAFLMKT